MKRKFYLSGVFVACMSLYAASANAQAPVITTNPTAEMVCQGTLTSFNMAATGASSYKWLVSTDHGITWSFVTNGGAYTGATTTTLEVLTSTSLNGYWYRGVAYEGTDSALTGTAILLVDAPASAQPITGPTLTCAGGSIHLANANVTGEHTWSASNGTVAIAADGTVTAGAAYGKDTITYTFHNTCPGVVTSTATVTVDTVLAHGEISGTASTICAGTWAPLEESVGGGVWISSNTAVATVDGSGNVTGVSLGTSVISYYRSNGCGAVIDTYDFNIETPAAPIMSATDSVGIGATLALSDAVIGGTWSSSDVTIAGIDVSGTVTGVAAGSATVYYDVANTCGSSEASMTVYVGTAPSAGAITGVDSVCVGAQITLAGTVAGGTWTSSNDTMASVDASGIVTGLHYGLDTVYYTVTNAFGSSSVRKKIFINQPPVVSLTGPAIVALGGGYTLTGLPAGGTFSQTNPAMAPLIGYGFFVVMKSGTDTFYYHATNSCGTTTASFTIYLAPVPPAGVAGLSNSNPFSVYPNPANGAFTINIPSATQEAAAVVITNIAGETVKNMTVKTGENTAVVLDQPAGVYFISATTASGVQYAARVSVVK